LSNVHASHKPFGYDGRSILGGWPHAYGTRLFSYVAGSFFIQSYARKILMIFKSTMKIERRLP
jgi:hypothetical protein